MDGQRLGWEEGHKGQKVEMGVGVGHGFSVALEEEPKAIVGVGLREDSDDDWE